MLLDDLDSARKLNVLLRCGKRFVLLSAGALPAGSNIAQGR